MLELIGRNVFSLGLSRITSGLLLFFVYAKLASYLGLSDFGKFSLVLALQTIFLLFVDLGISRYVVKRISEDRSTAAVYYGNFLLAQLFLAVVVFLLFILIPRAFGYDADVARAMLFAGAGLLFTALSIPALAIIQAWQKIHLFAWVIFFESLLKAGWFVYAIVWRKDLVFIFAIYLFVGVFDIIIYWILTRSIAVPKFAIDKKMIRAMFFFGLPFAMLTGFEIVIAKIDIVIQKFFLPFSEVGLYSAAYRFLDFLTFVPAVVAISLFPFLSESGDLRTPEIKNILDRFNRYMIVLAVPLGVSATMFADKIVFALFGQEFAGSVLPFRILVWSSVITFIYAVPNVIMQVKRVRIATGILALAAALNGVANILLIPKFGILASAWLTVATYGMVCVLYFFYSRSSASYSFLPYIFWPVAASLVMGLGLWVVRGLNIFMITFIALFIYFAVLAASGFLNKEDWGFVKSLLIPR